MSAAHRTVDGKDQETWSRIAQEWWDLKGPMRPLHHMNPTRVKFITQQTLAHFAKQDAISPQRLEELCATYSSHVQRLQEENIDYAANLHTIEEGPVKPPKDAPLQGLEILDVGCGAGIVAEHLAFLGAKTTGVDSTPEALPVGRMHARAMGLDVTYVHGTTDDLVAQGKQFDVVCCLEVVEHVTDVDHFLNGLASLVRPGGLLVMSTPNRTILSYLAVIVAAERILGWIPVGAHSWTQFIRPHELRAKLEAKGLDFKEVKGLELDIMRWQWIISDRDWIDYFTTCGKPSQ